METMSPNVSFTRAEDLGTDVVDITVGPKRKRFVVHRQLLTSRSTYFKNAFSESNMGNDNKIYFDNDDPAAVALFVGWLYRGTIPGVAEMEKKIQNSVSRGNSVSSKSTSNGNMVPGEVPCSMNGQAALKPLATLEQVPAIKPLSEFGRSSTLKQTIKSAPEIPSMERSTPRAPPGHPAIYSGVASSTSNERTSLTIVGHSNPSSAAQTSVSTLASSPSSFSQLSQKSTPVFGHPHQNTSIVPPPVSPPKASAASKTASSPDPEREALQLALLHLCLFAVRLQWPAIFNQAIESYRRIVATRIIPPDQVELVYKRNVLQVLPLRRYILDHIAKQPGGDGHLIYMQLAGKYPGLMFDLFQKLRFPASIARNGHAENCVINPNKKYHM